MTYLEGGGKVGVLLRQCYGKRIPHTQVHRPQHRIRLLATRQRTTTGQMQHASKRAMGSGGGGGGIDDDGSENKIK